MKGLVRGPFGVVLRNRLERVVFLLLTSHDAEDRALGFAIAEEAIEACFCAPRRFAAPFRHWDTCPLGGW